MQKFESNVQTTRGDALSAASVAVYTNAAHTTLATIYSDDGLTQTTNPLATNSLGEFSFYAADGRYYLKVTKAGVATQFRDDVILFDPSASTGSAGIGFAASGSARIAGTVAAALNDLCLNVKFGPFGATGDGATDDHTAINSAITAAAASSLVKTVFVPPGTYIVSSSVVMKSGVTLYLAKGATLKAKAATDVNVVTCDSISDIRILGDGVIDGNLANQTGQITDSGEADGLRVELCSDVIIRGITVQNTKGWGVHVGGCTDVHTDNITVSGTQEKAFNYTGDCLRCTVTHSRMSSVGGGLFPAATGIEIDDGSTDVLVGWNTIDSTSSLGISVHSHDSENPPHNVVVIGNIIKSSGDHGIRVAAHRDANANVRRVDVIGNVIDGTDDGAGIAVITNGGTGSQTVEDVLISGNLINDTNDQGISVSLGQRVRVSNNRLRDLGDHGIAVDGGGTNADLTQYVHVEQNTVIDPGVLRASADRDGIHFANSGVNGWIVGNHVEETKTTTDRRMRYGVNVRDSDITGTRVEDNEIINYVTAKINNGTTDTIWGRPYILKQSAVAVSAGADTTEDTLATITIPANIIGPNGSVEVLTLWSYTNSANNKTLRVRFSGASGTQYLNTAVTTTATLQHLAIIRNVNSASSQKAGYNGTVSFSTSGNAPVTSSVDTTAATTVVITGQKASSGETLTLESYEVRVKPGW